MSTQCSFYGANIGATITVDGREYAFLFRREGLSEYVLISERSGYPYRTGLCTHARGTYITDASKVFQKKPSSPEEIVLTMMTDPDYTRPLFDISPELKEKVFSEIFAQWPDHFPRGNLIVLVD